MRQTMWLFTPMAASGLQIPVTGACGNYEGNKGDLLLKEAVYRIDARTATVEMVTNETVKPNGICFSPDYKKLYVADTGTSPGQIKVWDIADGNKLRNGREFAAMRLKVKETEMKGGGDGIRADIDGNIWVGAWGGEGFDGIHVFAPDGVRIGQILLPEATSNSALVVQNAIVFSSPPASRFTRSMSKRRGRTLPESLRQKRVRYSPCWFYWHRFR